MIMCVCVGCVCVCVCGGGGGGGGGVCVEGGREYRMWGRSHFALIQQKARKILKKLASYSTCKKQGETPLTSLNPIPFLSRLRVLDC